MTQCGGHFGLSMKYYCHFTSPIRRYPDLQIHRIIKENIHGKMNDKRIGHYNQILPEVAEEASRLERRADDAEREVEKMKKLSIWNSLSVRVLTVLYQVSLHGECMWNFQIPLRAW